MEDVCSERKVIGRVLLGKPRENLELGSIKYI
jgi:hypothetical protein